MVPRQVAAVVVLVAAVGCGGPSFAELCERACECEGNCAEQQAECEETGRQYEELAEQLDCEAELDEWIACLDEKLVCEDGDADAEGCEDAEDAIDEACSTGYVIR